MAASGDGSSRSSDPGTVVTPPTLEDVAEEEDVFLPGGPAEAASRSGAESVAGRNEDLPQAEQLESEFLHLTIRKQVSSVEPNDDLLSAESLNL